MKEKLSFKNMIVLNLAIVLLAVSRKLYYWSFGKIIELTEPDDIKRGRLPKRLEEDINFINGLYDVDKQDWFARFPILIKRQHKGRVRYDYLLVQHPKDGKLFTVRFDRHAPSKREFEIEA